MILDQTVFEQAQREGVERLCFASSACVYPKYLQDETGSTYLLKEEDADPFVRDKAFPDLEYGWAKFMGEMVRNRAGAEVSIGTSDKYSIVNYSENMNIMMGSMDRNRIRMKINSTDPSGKFIMMNLDNSSMMWQQGQKIRLYIDNMPMKQVMTSDELYSAKESSFWLSMPGGNRMQAMMYISNFSERTVDVVVEDESTPAPTYTKTPEKTPVSTSTPAAPGFGIGLGLIGASIAYRLGRKS